jgi:surfeit locus 1 family protein
VPLSRAVQPRYWGYHLVALLLLGIAGWLGLWQYDAWSTRRAAEAQDLTRQAPVPLDSAIGPDDPFPGDKVGQPVIVSGSWVPSGTIYISGREHDGDVGYWVVTPLATGGPGSSALEIVRGWTPSLSAVPPAPTGTAEFVAWLQPPEGTGDTDADPGDDVLPQLRIADAIQHVDQDLYGAYAIVADRAAPGPWPVGKAATNPGTEGLSPADLEQLPGAGRFTAVRNLLYAIEWWFFGVFAVLIWWRWVREEVLEAESDASRGEK